MKPDLAHQILEAWEKLEDNSLAQSYSRICRAMPEDDPENLARAVGALAAGVVTTLREARELMIRTEAELENAAAQERLELGTVHHSRDGSDPILDALIEDRLEEVTDAD